MRIDRLDLERYGHFEGVGLDLSGEGVRLHLIHGPNEGGKSTALSAICDLLFGIPVRSPYNFRHAYDRMRIGGTLRNAAGAVLSIKRRKGSANTLLTPEEAALPDGALAPFLGGIDRDGFERMFGLDHDRLRRGGEAMLAAGGDLARSLFEAGSGVASLAGVVEAMGRDADAIGSPERKSAAKPYWVAAAELQEAQERIRRQALKAEEWTKAGAAVTAAEERHRALNTALADLHRARARLDRIRRIQPCLRRLDDAMARLAALGDTPDLPERAEEEWREALKSRHMAEEELGRCRDALARLDQAAAELPDPGPWPALAGEVEGLVTDLGDFRTKLADEPKLARDIAHAEAQITARLRELHLTLAAESPAVLREVEAMVPPRPLVARIRARIRDRAALDADRQAAERELRAAGEALERHRAALSGPGAEPVDPGPARAALDQAGEARDLPQALAKARLRLEEGRRDLAVVLARLPRWPGDAVALAACPVPSIVQVTDHERRADARAAERLRIRNEVERQEDQLRRTVAALEGMQAAGTVPTPDAVRHAREARDTAWIAIRAAHGGGTVPDPVTDIAFEAALRRADDLADRVAGEAQRRAEFARLTTERLTLERGLEALARAEAELERNAAVAKAEWSALWSATGIDPGRPGEMRDWLLLREEVLKRLEVADKAERHLADLAAEATAVRGHLTRALLALGQPLPDTSGAGVSAGAGGDDLPAFRNRVKAAVLGAEAAWADRMSLHRAIAQAEANLTARRRALAEATTRLDTWAADWAADMPRIGLAPDAIPGEAEAALTIWESIAGTRIDLEQRLQRRDGIQRDLETYRARLSSLLARLGDIVPATERNSDPLDLVPVLARRMANARDAATRSADHARRRGEAMVATTRAADRLAKADAAIAGFRAAHGLAADADVPALARMAQERARLTALVAEIRGELLHHGDGLEEPALRAEAATVEADALSARLAALDEELSRIQGEVQEAAATLTTARAALRDLQSRDGIHDAAQQAANAARTMAELAGRWVRLKAAGLILSRAVERYRAANEHPLVRRAGVVFAAMAAGGENPVIRLSVDYADADHPVLVGIRQDGSRCPVEGMSEGTRDQLYLSLRIAAVEQAVAAGEPMPFIADDLFITSDEGRTEAGLTALADLGRHTQVLLFTHHRYVVEAAQAVLPPGTCHLHSLGPRAAAGAETAAQRMAEPV